jgi:hypothetical protein
MTQFFPQRLGLLQICRIKSLSEPAVDLGQHLPRFFFLTRLPPLLGGWGLGIGGWELETWNLKQKSGAARRAE